MTFTGNLTRRFFSQTDSLTFLFDRIKVNSFDKYISGNPLSGTGQVVKFGLSGIDSGNKLEFTFSGSKVYDPEGRFCFCYNNEQIMSISGNVETGHYDYFINNELFCSIGLTTNADFNCWYVSCLNSGNAEAEISVYNDTAINITQTNYNTFSESGFWTGYFISSYDKPLVIHSGELYGADAKYFSGYTGLSFENGNNILQPNTAKIFKLHQYSGSTKTGVFEVGLRLYGDFGVKDYVLTGASYIPFNPYFISNSLLPEDGDESLVVSGYGNSDFKVFNYSTLAQLNGSAIAKNIYVHVDLIGDTSLATGNRVKINSFSMVSGGSGYTNGIHKVYISHSTAAANLGEPSGFGVVLTNANKGVTGISWQHKQTDSLGVYRSGDSSHGPRLVFPNIVGGIQASGNLNTSTYVKTFSGLFDVVTGLPGTSGISLKTTNRYNATKFSGFSTLTAAQENMFIKVIYNAPYDIGNVFFRVSVSGLTDTIYGTTGLYYESFAHKYLEESVWGYSYGEETRG
jgi:hypothetical protein